MSTTSNKVATAPGYQAVAGQLRSAAVDVGVSEAHGLLCGLLCSGSEDAPALWRAELLGDLERDTPASGQSRRSLDGLFQGVRIQLEDPNSEFRLLLPDDAQPLKQRALALVEWCQGFLYGFGLCGVSERAFSEETREALRDITEITRMDQHQLEQTEANEEAYMEVSEFVRVAALLVREHMIVGSEQGQ